MLSRNKGDKDLFLEILLGTDSFPVIKKVDL